MPLSPGFADYVLELLDGFGPLEAKRMFGGAGLYHDGLMFGILDDDVVYFRVDDTLEAELKAQGSVPWSYSLKRDGAVREMGYWRMPETAADDPDEAVSLAKRAYAAALSRKGIRAKKPARKKSAVKAVAKHPPAKVRAKK
jgi:DNA transformation protein and related proteins